MGERTVEFIDMSDFVMPAADGDDVTGMGEPAVFDARQVGFCTCALLTELNLHCAFVKNALFVVLKIWGLMPGCFRCLYMINRNYLRL